MSGIRAAVGATSADEGCVGEGRAFVAFGRHDGWPNRALSFNPCLRLSAGLADAYATAALNNRCSKQPQHLTRDDGTLHLCAEMPLLARRYRFMHVLSQSPLSQLLAAVDTYRGGSPNGPDGSSNGSCSSPLLVVIKVLNAQHWLLGAQEYERMRRLGAAQRRLGVDAGVAAATGHFELGAHFCIVMPMLCEIRKRKSILEAVQREEQQGKTASELGCGPRGASLFVAPECPSPLSRAALGSGGVTPAAKPRLQLTSLRQIAAQMLGALCFLRAQGVLHADIKPDNVMLEPQANGDEASSIRTRVIDFSNSMTLAEAVMYHDTFDVQTLGYRAPEVIFGQPFSYPIDIWSLGVTLAELFSGRALVQAASRGGLAVQLAQLLGQPPPALFANSKHAAELVSLVAHQTPTLSHQQLRVRLSRQLGAHPGQHAQQLMDLIAGMLQYDPSMRLTPSRALAHAFFAPLFPFGFLFESHKDSALDSPLPCEDEHDSRARADQWTAAGDAPAPASVKPKNAESVSAIRACGHDAKTVYSAGQSAEHSATIRDGAEHVQKRGRSEAVRASQSSDTCGHSTSRWPSRQGRATE